MIRPREALRSRRTDEGFTLVEAVVSMVILGLLATGIITATNTVSRMTADNRSREIAVNLAEAQLDLDRGILDPFKITAFGVGSPDPIATPAKVTTISGRDYSVSQATSLVGVDGADITCGSGKTIYYRRISVTVDWTGRFAATTDKVQSDTVIAPNGRINDASTGSIAVQVNGASGVGEAGVAVSIAPLSGGAAALQTQPSNTNSDGCSFALGVTPGTYNVTISRPASVDTKQSATSVQPVTVAAGATAAPPPFTYDQSATFPITYPASATLPTSMPVTFLNAGAPYFSSGTPPVTLPLFPYPAGYTALAGAVVDTSGKPICAAENPAAWTLGTGKTLASGATPQAAAAGPAATASPGLTVPMGVFTVKSTTAVYLTAVAQNVALNGQPGCSSATVASTVPNFTYPKIAANTTTTLALPYGTYVLSSSTTSGGTTTPILATMAAAPVTSASTNGSLSSFAPLTSTLTLDPRSGS